MRYIFTIGLAADTRVSTSTPKMNMNFSRRGKLSNEFSFLSPCVLLPGDTVIRETSRFSPGRSMNRAIERIAPRRRDNRYVIPSSRRHKVSRIATGISRRAFPRGPRAAALYLLTRSKRVKPCKFTYARPVSAVSPRAASRTCH